MLIVLGMCASLALAFWVWSMSQPHFDKLIYHYRPGTSDVVTLGEASTSKVLEVRVPQEVPGIFIDNARDQKIAAETYYGGGAEVTLSTGERRYFKRIKIITYRDPWSRTVVPY